MEDWPQDKNSTLTPAEIRSREDRAAYIKALLREKEGCERRGLTDRVALIDAELKRCGHEAAKPVERSERRPSKTGAERRG